MESDKVILITGGNKGIGYGIARYFLIKGFKVAISSRTEQGLNIALESLKAIGGDKVIGSVCDVRDFEHQQAFFNNTLAAFGRIDIVIANAGIGYFAHITDMANEKFKEVIDTNLLGVYYTFKQAIEPLQKTKGYLFSISSLAGTNFFAGGAAYNASKFGVTGFTQAAMLDLRELGIRVSTIMPGSVTSHFNNHQPNESDTWKIQPEDLAEMIYNMVQLNPRTLPSKIEVRPSMPPSKI